MIDKMRSFINENALIKENDTVLIALSGGMDSAVLFDLLNKLKKEMKFKISAVHFDHMIRESSSKDALFAEELCAKNNVEFFMSKSGAKQYAQKEKLSLETAARILRHAYIKKVSRQIGAQSIAFAHHKNDRAETYLMRVIRGTGGDGLGCMPERDGMIIRPLLFAQKEEIQHYAKANMLKWREDETNRDESYTRNRLRHSTIEHLKENYNPAIVNTLANNSKLMSVDRDYFEIVTNENVSKAKQTENGYFLDDDSFIYLHRAILTRCIRKVLANLGIEQNVYENNIADVLNLFYEQNTGAMINLPSGAIARREAFGVEILRDEGAPPVFYETYLDLNGTTYVENCGTFLCEDCNIELKKIKNHSKNVAFFDTMDISSDLVIRTRRQGDSFYALGAPGKKTLKKYFIDKKISRFKRDFVPLIANGDEILWVVGYEVSENVKVTPNSAMIKKITFTKDK